MAKDKICFDNLHVESISFYKIKAKIQCKTITALHDLKINDNCECDSQAAGKSETGRTIANKSYRSAVYITPKSATKCANVLSACQFTFLLGTTPETNWFNEAKLKITQFIKSG